MAWAKSFSPARLRSLAAPAMFALLVAAYAFSVDIRASRGATITGDEPFYLITTQSLLEDGDLDLANQYESRSYASFFDHKDGLWRQSVPDGDGRILSPHNIGLSVYLLPGFALAGRLGAQVQLLLTAALLFALAYVFTARVTGAALLSWLATLAVALCATPFVYATEIYPEIPAALALIAALLLVPLRGRAGAGRALLFVLAVLALPWLGVKYFPLGLIATACFLWRATWSGRAALAGGGLALGLHYVWFHLHTYGGLTPYNVNMVYAGEGVAQLLDSHVAFGTRFYRLWGILIDERFGLGRWSPFLLLAIPGAVLAMSRDTMSRLVAALIGAQLLIATFVVITMMGWWFPGRTMATVVPLFAVPIVLYLKEGRAWARALAVALAAYSLAVTASLAFSGHVREIVVAVDPFEMGAPFFRHLKPLFPDYRLWNEETYIVTAAWLALGAVSVAAAVWEALREG
ncbi:MAG: hypothetical protein FJ319_08800 [SAR202 cluster bacterium]|nr:hypothetical protein [SAR202 cluster bacterium]